MASLPALAQSPDAGDGAMLSMAPVNPEFLSYQQSLKTVKIAGDQGCYSLGYIPTPVDLSYLRSRQVYAAGSIAMSYPSAYDLRTLNKVSPIKDQNPAGTCWAFASYGSLESYLLPGESWDFSENNMKNTAGFDLNPNTGGGNQLMSAAYLTRWSGPVREQDDPYNPNTTTSPSGLTVQKHVQDVLFIPGKANGTDNDNIKWALTNYGAVYTTIYVEGGFCHLNTYDDAYFNKTHTAYYYNTTADINHAVTIVGWDDGFSRYNFSTTPPGDGAFIVKNSWGTVWGDEGYFYVSYYDENFGLDNAVFTAGPAINYNHVYQYDPLGWTNNVGYGSNTAWFRNVFHASGSEKVNAVGFYLPAVDSSYDVYVYNASGLAGVSSGTAHTPGYYTFTLNSSVRVSAGEAFDVRVRLVTPGINYPICIEYPLTGYSSKATASAGQSYVSSNGDTWSDITASYAKTSVCLKAYTVDDPGMVSGRVTASSNGSIGIGQAYVAIVNADNTGEAYYNTTTDPYGYFTFSSVASTGGLSSYRVYTNKSPYGDGLSAPFSVSPGSMSTVNVSIVMQPCSINIVADNDHVHTDGSDSTLVTAYVTDALGQPAGDGQVINFSLSNTDPQYGSLGEASGSAPAGSSLSVPISGGMAGVKFGWATSAGANTITAAYGGIPAMSDSVDITLNASAPFDEGQASAQMVSADIPNTIMLEHTYAGSITFRNTGPEAWNESSLVRMLVWGSTAELGIFGDANNFGCGYEEFQIPAGTSVQPGETYTWNFDFEPNTAGYTCIGLTMAHNRLNGSVVGFGQPTFESIIVTPASFDIGLGNAWYQYNDLPSTMVVGQTYNVSVTYMNDGWAPWSEADSVRLLGFGDTAQVGLTGDCDNYSSGYPEYAIVGDPVLLWQLHTYNFTVTPTAPGTYTIGFAMVQNSGSTVTPFGGYGYATVTVNAA